MLPDLELNDVLQLRKTHPCGEDKWKVVRLGGDIKIECLGCGRRIMMPRRELARKTKKKVQENGG